MSDFEKIKEKLPSKENIYNSLTSRRNTNQEYEHVLKIWNKSELKTMKDYHDLFLKGGVLLLAVFEIYRNNNLKNYELCPSRYLIAPRLSWDAMFKTTKIEVELIPDPDMYIFFEKGTRSKISYVPNNYRKADNKYLESYDWKQESKHIIYLDENNLYGYKISKFYPTVDSNG